MYVNTDGTVGFVIGDSSGNEVNSAGVGSIDGGAWHFLCLTWDGSAGTATLFIDGVKDKEATNASVGSITDTSATLAIGADTDGASAADELTLALFRLSATAPSTTQIRQMYDAEKPMFVASAECLLQSGSTDAVLDVDVDPLTNKVLVTQTDAITIFDGLAVDSKPTVNSGSSEKGKLWGALRAEQNSANAYVTAPAVDQRQVNEMVRGLASDLPQGVDLSKAKAWITFDGLAISIKQSFNIKSLTSVSTGVVDVNFAVPFKGGPAASNTMPYAASVSCQPQSTYADHIFIDSGGTDCNTEKIRIRTTNSGGGAVGNQNVTAILFGELENE